MEQQQFKVSRSVSTKLLISIVSLLFIVIVFLNFATILILTKDKRDYIYQSQSSEARLTGRELVNTLRHVLDTLRLSLASVDPSKPSGDAQRAALRSVVSNQSDVVYLTVRLGNLKDGKLQPFAEAADDKQLSDLHLTPQDLEISPELFMAVSDELMKQSYAFVNLSKLGEQPLIGVLLADLKLKDNPGGVPVAIGVVSLKNFASELRGLNLTVATKSGWVLFDADPSSQFSRSNNTADPLYSTALTTPSDNGSLEFMSGGERYLGSYVKSDLDIIVMERAEWKKAVKATYWLAEKFILLGIMAIGAAIIFAIFFSKTLTAPINRLYQATREVAAGNFNLDLQSSSKDEIGALTSSFNVMSRRISDLVTESMAKVQLENELAIASTVQQTLIPEPIYRDDKIVIHSHYQAATTCGGDWWGFFEVRNKMCLMIADATGHGFPSALMTASARSCFSVLNKLAQEDPNFSFSPSIMLSYANRVIYEASMGRIMMTFFIGVIDFDTKTLTYASAAHNPPWLFKFGAEGYSLKSMTAVGPRLGESLDPPAFEEKTVQLSVKDVLFLYTDGLMEGKSTDGEMYGKKRPRRVIEAGLLAGTMDTVVAAVMEDFVKFNEGKPLDDDVTLAAAMLLEPGAT